MKIKWYGHAAFRIAPDAGPSVITDPYTPEEIGYSPISDPADLVIISSDDDSAHCRADLIKGSPAVLNALNVARSGGLASAAGLEVSAIEVAEWDLHPDHDVPIANGMYRFTLDGIRFAHIADVGNALNEEQTLFFEDVDVLFALAGGHPTIQLPDLAGMIYRMKPKLVIPMHFRTLTYLPRNILWIESFLKFYRDEAVDFPCASEVELCRDDIPESTRVLVMDYVR